MQTGLTANPLFKIFNSTARYEQAILEAIPDYPIETIRNTAVLTSVENNTVFINSDFHFIRQITQERLTKKGDSDPAKSNLFNELTYLRYITTLGLLQITTKDNSSADNIITPDEHTGEVFRWQFFRGFSVKAQGEQSGRPVSYFEKIDVVGVEIANILLNNHIFKLNSSPIYPGKEYVRIFELLAIIVDRARISEQQLIQLYSDSNVWGLLQAIDRAEGRSFSLENEADLIHGLSILKALDETDNALLKALLPNLLR